MRRHVALAVAVFLSLLISSSAKSRIELANSRVDPGGGLSSEWLILTKQNFSSEIRLHPHILLLVTIPWCGEARSLMKQIADLVSDQQEKHGHLRLMVVYKNSEKILSEILGAVEDITLFYYHQFTSYKYNGRLRAENILYSVNYLASLNSEDVPLKLLHSWEELEVFLKSTDKAVLLIELCGWSNKLLQKRSSMQFSLSLQNYSENDIMFGASLFQNVDEKLPLDKNQEGMDIEGLTCVENELPVSHLNGEFSWANHSVAEGTEHENGDTNMSCTEEGYRLFETFFSNFTRIAREHLLPLERTRFGLIPERTLLPYIGVKNMGAWLTMIQFNGCPRCSMILKAEDDLKKVLRENHSPVMQVDMDGDSLQPAFPENRPSVVLFIDRLSDLPSMREKSKSALEAVTMLAEHYQMPYTVPMDAPGVYTRSSPKGAFKSQARTISDSLNLQYRRQSLGPEIVKIKDNLVNIINRGQSILSDQTASRTLGNAAYDVLLDFLSNRNSVRRKQTKMSFLAKEIGFQLLSDDFEIQVMDSNPNDKEKKQLSDMNEHTIASLGDQALALDQTSNEDFARKKHDTPTVLEVATVDNVNSFEHENAVDDLHKYQETGIKDKENADEIGTVIIQEFKDDSSNFLKSACDEDDGGCKKNDVGSLARQDETCSLKQEVEVVETCIEKNKVKDVFCGSNSYGSVEKVMLDDPEKDFTENNVDDIQKIMQIPMLSQPHIQNQSFQGSFFFVDGGYRLLRSLTGGSNIPSLVLLDPILQHHYVFNEDVDITYSSLVNFLDKFLNGSLSPHQLSASSIISYREPLRPPFVNLDFHEVDPIPRVTTNTFCELVFGFDPCVGGATIPSSQLQNLRDAWNKDVLVFFGSSWCGFCQRVELIVREVYRAFKILNSMLDCDSSFSNPLCPQGDIETYNLPSVFLMDCVQNDCAYFLKAVGKNELYPELLLYPALNKSAIPYEDIFSVVNIMKFLESQGRDSLVLSKYKGSLWKQSWNSSSRNARPHETTSSLISKAEPIPDVSTHQTVEPRAGEQPLVEPTSSQGLDNKRPYIVSGSMLFATEKLLQAMPFDNSSILIVFAGEDQALQGVIINKPISWDVFDNLEKDLETIKQAPLYYGGPVRAQGLPLVSLTRKTIEGFSKVIAGLYFGNPVITSMVIEGIKSGDRSARDYWFFLGYSSWGWDQLFDEVAEGAWHVSSQPVGTVDWPKAEES